ncbi:MAG: hypothetical protein K8U57_27245 [Planctomycetes bacterium]|nr:hypothetical protein [Planctomycetota bacterium]
MFPLRWLVRLGAVALMLGAVLGCGSDPAPKTYPVQGSVTLDKKPLEKGTIYFKIVQTGDLASFEIKDGEFSGKLPEGERRVEIVSMVSKGVKDFNGMKGEVTENVIPPDYNVNSKLTATVTRDGPNKFTFDVKSK